MNVSGGYATCFEATQTLPISVAATRTHHLRFIGGSPQGDAEMSLGQKEIPFLIADCTIDLSIEEEGVHLHVLLFDFVVLR